MKNLNLERWVSVRDAAQEVGCSESAIRQRIYNGALRFHKVGVFTVVDLEHLRQIKENGELRNKAGQPRKACPVRRREYHEQAA